MNPSKSDSIPTLFTYGLGDETELVDWPYTTLFLNLSTCIRTETYDFTLLAQITNLLLGITDQGITEQQPITKHKTKESNNVILGEEDEDDDDEEEEDIHDISETTTTDSNTTTNISSSIDDNLNISPPSLSSIISNFTTSLPIHQRRSFLSLYLIFHSYAPISSTYPLGIKAPLLLFKQGDLLCLWLLHILCSIKNRETGLLLLWMIQLLGSTMHLRRSFTNILQLFHRTEQSTHVLPHFLDIEELKIISLLQQIQQSMNTTNATTAVSLTPSLSQQFTSSTFYPFLFNSNTLITYNLRATLLRVLQTILTDSITPLYPTDITTLHTLPNIPPALYFSFIDTPLFPRIPGPLGNVGHGYTCICWISITSLRDSHNNIFRYFSDKGNGIQIFLKGNNLCIRPLPNSTDHYTLKNFNIQENTWYFIALTHRPKPSTLDVSISASSIAHKHPTAPMLPSPPTSNKTASKQLQFGASATHPTGTATKPLLTT